MTTEQKFAYEPWIVFYIDRVREYLTREPEVFDEYLEENRVALAKAAQYRWANSHFMIQSRAGNIYSFYFHISKALGPRLNDRGKEIEHDNNVSLRIWDSNERSVHALDCNVSDFPTEEWKVAINAAMESIKQWDDGIRTCCECGAQITDDGIAGRYFSGIYCQKCWDNKWKAIEAKETYN